VTSNQQRVLIVILICFIAGLMARRAFVRTIAPHFRE